MLIDLIRDIDRSDYAMKVLEDLASRYGLFNMTVVLMKTHKLLGNQKGQKIMMQLDETTYRQTVATFLALAVMNFASAKHEHFSIQVNDELVMDLSRNYPSQEHIEIAKRYVAQAKEIIGRYEPS